MTRTQPTKKVGKRLILHLSVNLINIFSSLRVNVQKEGLFLIYLVEESTESFERGGEGRRLVFSIPWVRRKGHQQLKLDNQPEEMLKQEKKGGIAPEPFSRGSPFARGI